MRKETRYMRNSHNMVNESGTQMPKASNVQIAHMDMKPLLHMVFLFFFMLLILEIGSFIWFQNQIQDLKTEVAVLKTEMTVLKEKPTALPYIVHHEPNK